MEDTVWQTYVLAALLRLETVIPVYVDLTETKC